MLRVRVDVLDVTHASDDTIGSKFLTSAEVATVFRVRVATVSRWVRQGKLDAVRTPGGRMLFRVTDVDAFIAPRNAPRRSSVRRAIVNRLAREMDELADEPSVR